MIFCCNPFVAILLLQSPPPPQLFRGAKNEEQRIFVKRYII